jgi:hypothetical protein
MDDATLRFLIEKRIKVMNKKIPLEPIYKEKIIELTNQMMEDPFSGSIQIAFDNYISECMTHFKNLEKTVIIEPPKTIHDTLLYPKKINQFTKKGNEIIFLKK